MKMDPKIEFPTIVPHQPVILSEDGVTVVVEGSHNRPVCLTLSERAEGSVVEWV